MNNPTILQALSAPTTVRAYHGSNSAPFEKFDYSKCGTGVVGSRYRGVFFFTSSLENAEYYTDTNGHVSLWEIPLERPLIFESESGMMPCDVLRHGCPVIYNEDGTFDDEQVDGVIIKDILDGDTHGDVVFVFNAEIPKRIEVVKTYPADVLEEGSNTLRPLNFTQQLTLF